MAKTLRSGTIEVEGSSMLIGDKIRKQHVPDEVLTVTRTAITQTDVSAL